MLLSYYFMQLRQKNPQPHKKTAFIHISVHKCLSVTGLFLGIVLPAYMEYDPEQTRKEFRTLYNDKLHELSTSICIICILHIIQKYQIRYTYPQLFQISGVFLRFQL